MSKQEKLASFFVTILFDSLKDGKITVWEYIGSVVHDIQEPEENEDTQRYVNDTISYLSKQRVQEPSREYFIVTVDEILGNAPNENTGHAALCYFIDYWVGYVFTQR